MNTFLQPYCHSIEALHTKLFPHYPKHCLGFAEKEVLGFAEEVLGWELTGLENSRMCGMGSRLNSIAGTKLAVEVIAGTKLAVELVVEVITGTKLAVEKLVEHEEQELNIMD